MVFHVNVYEVMKSNFTSHTIHVSANKRTHQMGGGKAVFLPINDGHYNNIRRTDMFESINKLNNQAVRPLVATSPCGEHIFY